MDQTYMKKENVLKLLITMALPMVISMLVNSLYNIVDSFFVAQISEDAMTAISLVFPMQNFINSVMIGFGIGINSVISFYMGAQDKVQADKAASQGILLATIHGIVMTAGCIMLIKPFLCMFTNDSSIVELGLQYSYIAFAFSTILAWQLVFEKTFQAVGRMTASMTAMLGGCITNILLDPMLIFGVGIFPDLGIRGAAIATGIGQTVSLLVYVIIYILRPMPVRFTRKCMKPEKTLCLVNFKTEKPSYKTKHSVENPIEKQAIFENHHEPIIDTQMWERVQELRKQRKRPNRYDEVGLFSGILFCADCGSVLYQQRYQNATRKQDCYICGSYKKRTRDCTAHFIRTDLLTAGVTDNLRKVTSYAAKHEARFMKLLIEQNEDGGKRRNAARKKELEAAEKRISELSAIFKRLYEDSVTGRISDERFTELSADYEAEQKELKERAAAIRAELSKAQEATVNAEKFMNVVRKYTSFEELTPTLLREFVEKIVVHECSYDENGTRRQDIDIYYSFVGKVDLPE